MHNFTKNIKFIIVFVDLWIYGFVQHHRPNHKWQKNCCRKAKFLSTTKNNHITIFRHTGFVYFVFLNLYFWISEFVFLYFCISGSLYFCISGLGGSLNKKFHKQKLFTRPNDEFRWVIHGVTVQKMATRGHKKS